jgi:hypothetical protein
MDPHMFDGLGAFVCVIALLAFIFGGICFWLLGLLWIFIRAHLAWT